jgi:dipeptidyl aminopeptidase/acylaminoacyl peptidase
MKIKIISVIASSFLSIALSITSAEAAEDYQVPLLDRALFFEDPEYASAEISPDGKWIAFVKPYQGIMNIWVKAFDQPFEAAWPVTADTKRPVRSYFWSQNSDSILYVQDNGGDENFHIYALDPATDIRKDGVAPPRDLTPLENVRAAIYALPESTPEFMIIGLNDRDPRIHDVYRLSIKTGARELLVKNDALIGGWTTDLSGKVRLAVRQNQEGGTEILKVNDGKVGDTIYTCNALETCGPSRFHKDGKRFYMITDKGQRDLTEFVLMDYDSGKLELVSRDPEGRVNFGGASFSDATEELVAVVYNDDRLRIIFFDKDKEKRYNDLKQRLPDGDLSFPSSTEDESRRLISISSDVNPTSVYAYDEKTDQLTKLFDTRPDLPSDQLATMKAIRYEARDAVEIPAYLTLPRVASATNLPTVILPHGGPWGRDSWGYDSFAQFLANRGYAVLQPNFRGSAGFGKAFLNAGNNEWGTGIMQHDITDGVAYLIKEKIADPDRIAIMGGSYGGYATLAGVTFTPTLYAAGVSIVGPSNLLTLLNSIPPYWAPQRKMFMLRVGDLDTEAGQAQLRSQSPFLHAKQIEAPMLIVQGANDPRVKKAESDQIVVALRDAEHPVEYLLAENEGHGYANVDNRMAMFVAIEAFLAKHIGGRYQSTMPEDIAERLAELTVDIGTVSIPKSE